ncbi:MAG: homoserine dehydrogenase, partial [Hungatella sp.]
ITKITDIDFKYADKMGTSIKLFGSSHMEGNQVYAWVAPLMIGKDHPLYSVNDVYNGILVRGNMLGTTMYYGSGAGKLPTASAVVADIIEAVKHKEVNIPLGWSEERLTIAKMEHSVH